MELISQFAFIAVLLTAVGLFSRNLGRIWKNIRLGREETMMNDPVRRWKNLLLLAFAQKKMFKNPLVAMLHLVIYAGFIIINIEVLEIIADGVFGTHRLFAKPLGELYSLLINSFEWLAVGVIIVCLVFLSRRNLIRIKRFNQKELEGWPRKDANLILLAEILLMMLFLIMNASDTLLQKAGITPYVHLRTGDFVFSAFFHPLFTSFDLQTLVLIERTAWWMHIIGILAFLNYLPYSKHLHILFAFPNAYFARLQPNGTMNNMPEIQREVELALYPEKAAATSHEPPSRFGAKDVFDLSWHNLLEAYSCTECGRCTTSCPANITGKALSPRKIMMDTRDRLESVGKNIQQNGQFIDDGKSLLHDHIKPEEIRACTTCNACVEACPVSISPLDIILQLRRYQAMEESQVPQEWTGMFSNTENNFAPWKFSPSERQQWTNQ